LLASDNIRGIVATHTIAGEKLVEHYQPGKQLFHEQKSTATNKPHLSHPKKEKTPPHKANPNLETKDKLGFF
jgi:hypothetical protein